MTDKIMAQQQGNIELLRCLYHLDLFRRSIRKISNTKLNNIKDLFNNLTIVMSDYSENNMNPNVINNMINNHLIQASWSGLKQDSIYEMICKEMNNDRDESMNNQQQIQPLLHYDLTKICTTCGSSTPMNGCVKTQYIISMEPIDTLTFEEQIIASLDSNEFCEQSNCFGHQRTYRSQTKQPNIYTFDYKQTQTYLFNLYEFLNPSLVFQTQQDIIYKITAITLNPSSSLVYHSRLNIWLFINNNIIKPLCSNFNNIKYNFNNYTVQLVFYTVEYIQQQQQHQSQQQQQHNNNNVIYQNWTTTTTSPITGGGGGGGGVLVQNIKPLQQIININNNNNNNEIDNETEYYDSGISSYNSSIETHENPINPIIEIIPTIKKSNLNNYATIKRNRSKCKNIMKSISVPNLAIPIDLTVKRKVSFNCDIELIDLNEEYNPHPILMKILEKMKI